MSKKRKCPDCPGDIEEDRGPTASGASAAPSSGRANWKRLASAVCGARSAPGKPKRRHDEKRRRRHRAR